MGKKLEQANIERATLERKLREVEAQLVHNYHFADAGIGKLSTAHLMGSGVIIDMAVLGGRKPFSPMFIRDGLSDETIAALKNDIRRSYVTAIAYRPSGFGPQKLVDAFYELVSEIGADRMTEALDNLRKTHLTKDPK